MHDGRATDSAARPLDPIPDPRLSPDRAALLDQLDRLELGWDG